jgi:hypothetical protein
MIDIVRMDGDLSRKVWTFAVFTYHNRGFGLTLESYAVETKPSRRHKWRPVALWERTPMDSDYDGERLPIPASIPDDVQAELRQRVAAELTIAIPKSTRWQRES